MQAGKRVQASVQSAFGCGYEGPIEKRAVLDIVQAYLDAGVRNISLADTAGHAHPMQVEDLYGSIRQLDPTLNWPVISTTPTGWAWPTAWLP